LGEGSARSSLLRLLLREVKVYQKIHKAFLIYRLRLCIGKQNGFEKGNGAIVIERQTLKRAQFGKLSKILTVSFCFLLSSLSVAKNQYPMMVVKEAWVQKDQIDQAREIKNEPMNCITESRIAFGEKEISPNPKWPQKYLRITKNRTLFLTQGEFDPSFGSHYERFNTVRLWLADSVRGKMKYYNIADIDMERYEIPEIHIDDDFNLSIKADTIVPDYPPELDPFQIETHAAKLFEAVKVGAMTEKGLEVMTRTCIN
jgi:hypothetical protein